ncbi:MAG: DUF1573 domain-containing protein [Halanaerobiales bacterium]
MIYKNTHTKKRISAFLFLIFIFIIFLTGCNKTDPPKLVLSEDNWYYGEVTPDQRPSHDFTIKNEGGEKLIIESVYSSCPCVILELPEKEILPGEKVSLMTTFDPTGYEGEVSKAVTIKSNDPENLEKTIKTTITVQRVPNPDIELSEQKFDLGNFSREEKTSIKFTIFNTGDADLIIKEVVSEEIFNHNIKIPLTIAPREQFQVELSVDSSQLKKGEFRKAVRIMTNDPQNPALFLRIQGNIE